MVQTSNPEYNYQVALFSIRALSNLHPGSASENYGIIDNLVQRDPATRFPCINASSLKGALREYCRNYLSDSQTRQEMITYIFGLDKKDSDDNADPDGRSGKPERQVAGAYRFLPADLISFPLRGDERLYFNATCPWLLTNLNQQMNLFRQQFRTDWVTGLNSTLGNAEAVHFGQGGHRVDLDELVLSPVGPPAHHQQAKEVIGEAITVLKDKQFCELVGDYHLPVIARNNLEDGRSTNLWYEQVLPRETRFAFFVLYPKGEQNRFAEFKAAIEAFPVQIGANASVGYGFCEFKQMELEVLQ